MTSPETTHPFLAEPWLALALFVLPAALTFAGYAGALHVLAKRMARKTAGAWLELVFYATMTTMTAIAAASEWSHLGELRYVSPITSVGIGYLVAFFGYELVCLEKRRLHAAHHLFFIALFLVIATQRYYYGWQPLFVLFETISAFNVFAYLRRHTAAAKPLYMLNLYVHAASLALGPALLGFIALTADAHNLPLLGLIVAGVVGNAVVVVERLYSAMDRFTMHAPPSATPADAHLGGPHA